MYPFTLFRQAYKSIIICLLLCFQLIPFHTFSQTYCTPAASNCSSFNYRIDLVSFGTINNPSLCSANGYGNYSATVVPAIISAGTYVPMSVKVGTTSSTVIVSVGIDFNHNGTFDANEISKLGTNSTSNALVNGMVRIPFNTLTGNTRMRVVGCPNIVFSPLCSSSTYGETEDYTITILPATTTGPNFGFYVNKSATGLNNGLSWANAFTELSSALNYAQAQDTVRVASGTYKPGTLQTSTFSIKDSVILLGGYPNTGNPTDAQRNFGTNQTILNGQLITFGSFVNNLITALNDGKNFVIDGFIIEKGGKESVKLNAVSTAQIKNCVFRNNNGNVNGAIISCVNSNPVISNCYFHRNTVFPINDGIIINQNSNATFNNCVFANNLCGSSLIALDQSTGSFTNCTFVNDTSSSYTTIPFQKLLRANNNSIFNIRNTIFYNNILGLTDNNPDSVEIVLYNSVANISNSITQVYNYGNPLLFDKNPKFKDTASVLGVDNFYFTADDGLQLITPCSPAINAGLNSSVAGITKDILGNQRIFGTQVDLGAFEVQSNLLPIPATVYVNKSASGLNDGTSWANAFTDLHKALQYCSDTIRVAAGTYFPSPNDEKISFWLENKRVILGGYPNTGNPTDAQRNPATYPTILSGNLPAATGGARSNIIVRGRTIDSTSVMDGLNINDALGSGYAERASGLVLNNNASPKINNCLFYNNQKGAIYVYNSSPQITNCVFENNSVSNLVNNAAARFSKCLFKNNSNNIGGISPFYGGAIYNQNSNPVFDSCTFLKNKANDYGGAMGNLNSNPVITNCKFLGNEVGSIPSSGNASDMYNDHSSPQVFNTLFSDSTQRDYAGSIQNINQSNGSFTNCIFNNCNAYFNGGVCLNDSSSPVFTRCVFQNSKALIGSVLYNQKNSNPVLINCLATKNTLSCVWNDRSNPIITNCSFINNSNLSSAGVVIANINTSVCTITNSVFWGNDIVNAPTTPIADIGGNATTVTIIKNSVTQTYGTNGVNGNIVGINPRIVDITNGPGPDLTYFTADDGFRLCDCSPAINKGLNAAVSGINDDILNNPRIYGSSVDMGAYEFQSSNTAATKTYFVNAAATGTNDGLSWANAYKELRTAIQNTCSDTIKVAMGVYKPSVNSRDSSFFINRGLVIYGGYPNSGNPSNSLRNTDKYPTILSGDIGIPADSSDNTYTVMHIQCKDTSVKVEGLIFKHGNGGFVGVPGNPPSSYSSSGGGLLVSQNKNTTIRDCRFYNNYATFGSGLFTQGVSLIEKCVFSNNNASRGTYATKGSNTVIRNCVFSNNKAITYGGAVFCSNFNDQLNINFENTLFCNNTSTFRAAGVYFAGNTQPSQPMLNFTNCNFIKNNAIGAAGAANGIGLYYDNAPSQNLSLKIRNCIFKDNTFNGNTITVPLSDCYGISTPAVYQPFNIDYSATYTTNIYGNTYIAPNNVTLRNINNAIGADSLWFTADDGLQPDACALTTDKGNNASAANIPTDILQNTRTFNNIADIGAYEYMGVFTPVVNITASDSVICNGTAVTFTATATSAGTTPSYQWQVNGVNAGTNSNIFTSSTLNNNDQVRVILTGNPACATGTTDTSNIITMSVNGNAAPSVTIVASSTSICTGSIATFTATPANAGPTPSYQWQVNGVNTGPNNNIFTTTTLNNNDQVKVILTSTLSCNGNNTATSNIITIVVAQAPVVTVNNDTSICAGTSTQLQATGGTIYSWSPATGLNNANIANPVATPAITSTYIVSVSNSNCTTTDSVKITVTPLVTATVNINTATTNICIGSTAIFNATATNEGSNPAYQWQVNGINAGNNSNIFTSSTLNNNDQIKVILTSSLTCTAPVTSNTLTMSVTAAPIANAGNDTTICAGTSAQLQATGGSTYSWSPVTGLSNPNIANPVATPSTTTTYFVTVSNGNCTATDSIKVAVNAVVTPTVSISTATPNTCNGNTVTFAALSSNGGINPAYQWQVNGINTGTNSNTFTISTLNNNDQVKVILTSSLACVSSTTVTSNVITITVNSSVQPSASINTSSTSICSGTTAVFTAAATNGGANPVYQWQINGINTGNNSNTFTTSTLNNNDQVKVILTSSLTCALPTTATSNIISITVNLMPVANAGNDATVCAGSSVQLNGSGGTTYLWIPATGLNNPNIANPIASPAITTAYILTAFNTANCFSKDTVLVSVNQPATPTVNINTANNNICLGTAATFTASATNGGTNPAYQWQVNGINAGTNNNTFTSAALNNSDQVKVILNSNSSCVTTTVATSNIITVNVQQLAVPIVSLSNKVFTVTNPDVAATYTWQILTNNVWGNVIPAATGITYTAITTGEYRVKAVKGVCTSFSVPQATNFTIRIPANNPFGIYLYPNPASNIITLDSIKLNQQWETLDIIAADGKHVLPSLNIKNQTSVSIDVTALRNGTYFVQLRKKDGDFTTIKFVKQ